MGVDLPYTALYAEHCPAAGSAYCDELKRLIAEAEWLARAYSARDKSDAEKRAQGCFADPHQVLTSYPPQSKWICP